MVIKAPWAGSQETYNDWPMSQCKPKIHYVLYFLYLLDKCQYIVDLGYTNLILQAPVLSTIVVAYVRVYILYSITQYF